MLRVAGYVGAWIVLLLAGAWMALDVFATDIVRRDLERLELQGVVGFERAGLRLPSMISLSGIELDDPLTGQAIGRLETLEVETGLDRRPGRWGLVTRSITGRGGRVVLHGEFGRSSFARALEQLIDQFSAHHTGPREATPSMEFRELEIVVRSDDMALQVFRDCTVWVSEHDDLLRVEIRTGPTPGSVPGGEGGQVLLAFGVGDRDEGLREVLVRELPLEPPVMAAINPACDELARLFHPSGMVDLSLRIAPDESVEADGQISRAVLRPRGVPFALEDVTLPFTWRDDRLLIEDAGVRVAGGTLTTRVEHSPEALEVQAHLLDAELTRDLFGLVPGARQLGWLQIEDGGNVELHLSYVDRHAEAGPSVEGWGGLHAERILLNAAALGSDKQIAIEHVLGRFDIHDGLLQLHGMTGECAAGLVTLDGSFDTPTGAVDLDIGVRDVDLAEVHAALAPDDQRDRQLIGWLEGRLDYTGVLGASAGTRAHGQLSVRAADLVDVPIIGAIARAVKTSAREGRARQRLEIRFDLAGDVVDVRELRFDSDFLPLYANSGTVSLADQTLDLTIIPAKVPLGFVGDVVQFIEGQLIQVRVTGSLGEPSVAVFPIAPVTRPITGVFGWIGDRIADLFGFGD